jgi:hypothetical protein
MFERTENRKTWQQYDEIPNPIGHVPVVPMLNKPDVLGQGMSDLHVMLSLQDAINKLLADMLINSEYVSYPQRFATGVEVPKDANGRVIDQERWIAGPGRIWLEVNENAKFGQMPATDNNGYVKQVEMIVQHIAAQTRTPPHYLTAGLGQWPSGDSLKASEAGLVAKVKRKQVTYGEAWEEAMRLAFHFVGDIERAHASQAETIWQDPEQRSEAGLADALVKMAGLGVPLDAIFTRWGVSPQELARWRQEGALTEFAPSVERMKAELSTPPTETTGTTGAE